MCIVIDTNKLAEFFEVPARQDAAEIHKRLRRGSLMLVFGVGGGFGEIGGRLRRRLRDLQQAGRAMPVPAKELDQDARVLQGAGLLRSNDPHILALARASGARLLYTADQALIGDFKDPHIVSDPRGKVYSGAGNAGLLDRAACRRSNQAA